MLFRIEHRAPDSTRRWYLAPESLYGDSIISKGDSSYDVDPHRKRIIFTKDDALDDQVAEDDNFGLLLHNYRAVFGPDDSVAGRSVYSVLLVNKYTGATVMRIGVDKSTKLVLQKERYAPSGSVSHEMHFQNIRFTSDIPAQSSSPCPRPDIRAPTVLRTVCRRTICKPPCARPALRRLVRNICPRAFYRSPAT